MPGTLKIADTLREFTTLLYAETVSAAENLYAIDLMEETLKLKGIRLCCGSEKVNAGADGKYVLADDSPWLAELWFGSAPSDQPTSAGFTLHADAASRYVASLPCDALQGVGEVWSKTLSSAGIGNLAALAALSREQLDALQKRKGGRRFLEFYHKACIALSPPPYLPLTELDGRTPIALLSMTASQALAAAPPLTAQDWQRVSAYLGALVAVLNEQFLEPVTLRRLLKT